MRAVVAGDDAPTGGADRGVTIHAAIAASKVVAATLPNGRRHDEAFNRTDMVVGR